jgi:hypothetical protein
MEMAPQALGKIDFGDENGAIVVGGRRIEDYRIEATKGQVLAPNALKSRMSLGALVKSSFLGARRSLRRHRPIRRMRRQRL